MKKLIALIVLVSSAAQIFPYEYNIFNATNAPVYVDLYWNRLSLADEHMFQGGTPSNPYQTVVESAVGLRGPVQLLPNTRYTFKFKDWWNTGLCFDRLFIGWEQNSTRKVDVKIAESDTYRSIMSAANKFTRETSGTVQDITKTVGKVQQEGGVGKLAAAAA